MKKVMLLIVLLGITSGSCMAGPVRFRMEFQPLGGIVSPDAELSISKSDNGTYQEYYIRDGAGAYFGSLQGGVEIDTKIGYVDILLGGGLLALPGTDAESLPVGGSFLGDVGYRFKLNRSGTITIGPFVGVIVPTDVTLELTDETSNYDDVDSFDLIATGGVQGGLKFSAGGEDVSFNMKVGYASLSYDIDAVDDSTWNISYGDLDADELDMSGPFIQFGLSAQF